MANQIVQVNVTQQLPPAPSTLQRTGALISQGGTNTSAGTLTLLTQLSSLTPILAAAKAITSMTWSGSVVTVTTTAPHGWTSGDVIGVVISGVTPAGYNGTYQASVTGTSTFTFPLVSNPGSVTVQGTVLLADESELLAMATTFFAQGSANSVYVLELGEGTATEGVTALTSFITANPGVIYSYLVPREWDANAPFLSFLANYESTTAKTYFFVTTTTGNYSSYTPLMKCVFALIQAPTAPTTEFSCAAPFYVTLNWNPGYQVTQLSFAYVYGVTPYPTQGNSALLATLKAAYINVIGTGAEGGISNAIVFWGTTADGNVFNYWYSTDWVQINSELALANAVINGSNNPIAPLLYSQNGINTLHDVATAVFSTAVTSGLAIGQVVQTALPIAQFQQNFNAGLYKNQLVINAEPFLVYTTENPNDYAIGKYAGLAGVYAPSTGFRQIIFNISDTLFI